MPIFCLCCHRKKRIFCDKKYRIFRNTVYKNSIRKEKIISLFFGKGGWGSENIKLWFVLALYFAFEGAEALFVTIYYLPDWLYF